MDFDLSIIIVTWNSSEYIIQCLESIANHHKPLSVEVIIIDNHSTDGTQTLLENIVSKNRFSSLHLRTILQNRNLGFAKANNIGIRKANGRFILLLNPDTKIYQNTLQRSLQFLQTHPNTAVVGCRHIHPDGTLQPSVRRFPTLCSQLGILLKLHHLFPNAPCFQYYFAKDFDYSKTQKVDQVAGSFFLFPQSLRESVGLLDENFTLWFEEVDYCKRVSDAGKKVFYLAEAKILHYGSGSFRQVIPIKKQIIFNASLKYYFQKHGSISSRIIISLIHPISLLLSAGVSSIARISPHAVNKKQNNQCSTREKSDQHQ